MLLPKSNLSTLSPKPRSKNNKDKKPLPRLQQEGGVELQAAQQDLRINKLELETSSKGCLGPRSNDLKVTGFVYFTR